MNSKHCKIAKHELRIMRYRCLSDRKWHIHIDRYRINPGLAICIGHIRYIIVLRDKYHAKQ